MRRQLAHRQARKSLVEFGLRLLESGLLQDGQGNLSLYLPEAGVIAITPSALPYRQRQAEDICLIDIEGRLVEGRWKPTSEMPLHLAFYRERGDVRAVIHTHAPYATIFSISGAAELPMTLTEAVMHLGAPVPVAPYARPGTAKLAAVTCQAIGEGCAVIMAHHGLVTVGGNLNAAFHATLAVEDTARAVLLARGMGVEPRTLPPEEARALYELYQRNYRPQTADG